MKLLLVILLLPLSVIGFTAFLVRSRQSAAPRLHRPPGYRLLRFAEFFWSRKTYENVLAPTIADLQEEHAEALASGRLWKARWVRVRGWWSFWCAAGLQTVVSLGKRAVRLWQLIP